MTCLELISSYHTFMLISVVFFISTSSVNTSQMLKQVSGVLIFTHNGDETIDKGRVGTLQIFLRTLPLNSDSRDHSIRTSPYCPVSLETLVALSTNPAEIVSPSSRVSTGSNLFLDTLDIMPVLKMSSSTFLIEMGFAEIEVTSMDSGTSSPTGTLMNESKGLWLASDSLTLSPFVSQSLTS